MKILRRRQEKGIALLFALGMISLLLVMALAYATNAIIARKSALNNSNRARAKNYAQSAINRVMASLAFYDTVTAPAAGSPPAILVTANNIVSVGTQDSTGSEPADNSRLQLQNTSNPLAIPYEASGATLFYPNPKSPQTPRWHLLLDSSGRIIGRFAYAILPQTGKLPIPALNNKQETADAAGAVTGLAAAPTARLGANINELLLDIAPAEYQVNGRPAPAAAAPILRWLTPEQAFNKLGSNVAANRDMLRRDYEIFAPSWLEAYTYIDGVNVSHRYHRFDLTTLKDGIKPAAAGDQARVLALLGINNAGTAVAPAEFADTDAVAPATTPLPFLRKIGTLAEAGPYQASRLNLAKQIAANLIDYCTTDEVPTSNSSNWWGTPPDFTGNKKTYYFDEVAVGFELQASSTKRSVVGPPAADVVDIDAAVTPSALAVELAYVYQGTIPSPSYNVSVEGSVTVNLQIGDAPAISQAINFSGTGLTFAGAAGQLSSCVMQLSSPPTVSHSVTDIDPTGNLEVKVTFSNLNISKLYLYGAAGPVDFVREISYDSPSLTLAETMSADGGVKSASGYIGFAVVDPRSNLSNTLGSHDNWETIESAAESNPLTMPSSGPTSGSATFGSKNPASNALTAIGDQVDIFTNPPFFRNGPMISPAELGYIHRGTKGMTLNLAASNPTLANPKEYNPGAANWTADGIAYADGDGGILDQVKFSWKPKEYGKLNLNLRDGIAFDSANPTAVRALRELFRVKVKCPPTTFVPDGTSIAVNQDTAAATFNSTANPPYETRSEAIADLIAAAGASLADQAQKEEFIGKTLLLTEAERVPTVFQAVIVAQTIQDVGGATVVKAFDNGSGQQNETFNTGFGKFDATATAGPVPFLYADEITGEVKLLATIVRDPSTGKFHLISTEQIE